MQNQNQVRAAVKVAQTPAVQSRTVVVHRALNQIPTNRVDITRKSALTNGALTQVAQALRHHHQTVIQNITKSVITKRINGYQ